MSQPRCQRVTDQHNSFGNYYFLYINSTGSWHTCTNPVFIAKHNYCRAIPKEIVNDKLGYSMIADLVYNLNNDRLTGQELSVLADYDIHRNHKLTNRELSDLTD